MIGYVTIGVADLEKAKKFYCDLFEEQGSKIVIDAGRIAFIGTKSRGPMVAVCEPYNKEDPQPGNGTMIAFAVETKEEIDAFYDKAMALGATCDGAPGQRVPDRFYGAYVKDPDGNKLCFYIFG